MRSDSHTCCTCVRPSIKKIMKFDRCLVERRSWRKETGRSGTQNRPYRGKIPIGFIRLTGGYVLWDP